jgi:cytochrome bd-type quinol oxidase subunit 2
MRVFSNPLTRFRLLSALVLLVFVAGGIYAVMRLSDLGHDGWRVVAAVLALLGATSAAVLLYSSLFRAHDTGKGTVCFVPGSFLGSLMEGQKKQDLCPLFYTTALISLLVYLMLGLGIFVLTLVVGIVVEMYDATGLWTFFLLPSVIALIVLLVLKRETKLVEKGMIAAVVLFMLACVVAGVIHVPELAIGAYQNRRSLALDIGLGVVLIGAISLMAYIAYNWEKIETTWLGRLLAPIKNSTCVHVEVCEKQ